MEKYIEIAKKKEAETAVVISPEEIVFDRRAILKCRWGCEDQHEPNRIKCGSRGWSLRRPRPPSGNTTKS